MVGQLYGLSKKEAKNRAVDILEKLSLTEAANRPVKTYSGGMRRRLDLGASLVGHPKILFLDEPTTGLDPRTRKELWEIIRQLKHEGTSILLTTQYLEEADELADKIAVIDDGKLIAEGTSEQLKKRLGGDLVEIDFYSEDQFNKAVESLADFSKGKMQKDHTDYCIKIPVKNSSQDLLHITQIIKKSKLKPINISLHKPSLDDVFLSLTGKKYQSKVQRKTRSKTK
jgi:ABC-2 type transport system ATP-binding protein